MCIRDRTQIQEATLVSAPKIIAVFLALLMFLPYMGASMSSFMTQIASRIALSLIHI